MLYVRDPKRNAWVEILILCAALGTSSCRVKIIENSPIASLEPTEAALTLPTPTPSPAALTLSPNMEWMNHSANLSFTAAGGTPPFTYSIHSGGGSIQASSGVYTSGSTDETAQIKVTDSRGESQIVDVRVADWRKIVGPTQNMGRMAGDEFGTVTMDSDTLIVGAYKHDYDLNGGNEVADAGAVFIYNRVGDEWVFAQKLIAEGLNARQAGDRFGLSLALSGNTLVIGSPEHDYDATGGNAVNSAGAVFVYIRSNGIWSFQQKLVGAGNYPRYDSDRFGYSVAIDGDTIVAGAPNHDYKQSCSCNVNNAGAAFVFTRSAGVWSFAAKLFGEGDSGRLSSDSFGAKVAISGNTIAVGAPLQDYDEVDAVDGLGDGLTYVSQAGTVYIFTGSGSSWNFQHRVTGQGTNGRRTDDFFGYTLALDGDTLAVGAYGQDYDSTGANALTDAGAVYVYKRSGSLFSLEAKVTAQDRAADARLGRTLQVVGNRLLASAHREALDASGQNSVSKAGAAYLFNRSGSIWSQTSKIVAPQANERGVDDYFGLEGLAIQNNRMAVCAYNHDFDVNLQDQQINAGACWVFER